MFHSSLESFKHDSDLWDETSFNKNLCLQCVSINRKFGQNQFINECARNELAKFQ